MPDTKLKCNLQTPHSNRFGFTFIELIIVFTVTAIIGTIGVASLSSYNHRQEVATATLDLRTFIEHARSLAISQVKPSDCSTDLSNSNNNSTLLGYEVDFCANNKDNGNPGNVLAPPTGCRRSGNNGDYEINALCSNGVGYVNIENKQYSSVAITTDYASYFFPIISAGVDHAGTIKVSGYGKTQTITISNLGVIN